MAVAIAAYDARAFDDARAMSHSRVGFVMMRESAALVGRQLNARVYKEGAETAVFVVVAVFQPCGLLKLNFAFSKVNCFFVLFLVGQGRVPVVISMRK